MISSKEIFEKIKSDPVKYDEFFAEIDEYATEDLIKGLQEIELGNHFNAERLEQAYVGMKNKDGSTGAHWNIEETTAGALQLPTPFDYKALGYNDYDWNFTVNMMYSDYYKPNRAALDYLDLAADYIADIDVQDGKIYKYYERVILNNCD